MTNVNKLKGKFVENGLTQGDVANHLGMSSRCMTDRLNSGNFKTDEIVEMTRLLNINKAEEFMEIFFPDFVA